MSYSRSRDESLRGVGAIAAYDVNDPRRARARRRRDQAMGIVDQKMARLAHGKGRALPVAMGMAKVSASDSLGRPTMGTGGTTPRTPTKLPPNKIAIVNASSAAPAPKKAQVVPARNVGGDIPVRGGIKDGPISSSPPTPTPTPLPPVPMPPTPLPTPVPATPVISGGSSSGSSSGGGGGGAGILVKPPVTITPIDVGPMVDLTPTEVPEMSTTTKVAIGVGVLGALFLLSRRG